MRCADAAMYEAKRRGKSMWRRFDAAMQAQLEQTLQLESDLRAAVLDPADTQLHLHYQPQLDVAGGTYMGVEALLRWDHPELGRIPPDRFVPIAERTGLIDALGRRVLADACAQWLRWRAAGLGSLRVAVNVSPRQFALGDVHAEVVQVLAATGMPPAFLEVEVTESCMIEAPQEVITTLHRPARARRAGGDGRFRHRTLLPRGAARSADRHAEDRPELHLGAGAGRAQGRDRADGADACPHARARGGGRGGSRPRRSSPSCARAAASSPRAT